MTRLTTKLPVPQHGYELDTLQGQTTPRSISSLGGGLFNRSRDDVKSQSSKQKHFAPGDAREALRNGLIKTLLEKEGLSQEHIDRIVAYAPKELKRLQKTLAERAELKGQLKGLKEEQTFFGRFFNQEHNAKIATLQSRINILDQELKGVHMKSFRDVVVDAKAHEKAKDVMRQQKAHTRTGRLAAKFESKPYDWPVQKGKLALKGADISSEDEDLNNMVSAYTTDPAVALKLKAALRNSSGETDLEMACNPEIDLWYRGMKAYSHIREVEMRTEKGSHKTELVNIAEKEDEKDPLSDEVGIDTSVLMFRNLVNLGQDAFGKDARPLSQLVADPAKVKIHPSDFAGNMAPVFTSKNNPEVAKILNEAAVNHPDLNARQAGSRALERATQTDYAVVPWILSVGLSGLAGYFLEIMAGDASLQKLFAKKLQEAGLTEVSEEMIAEMGNDTQKFLATLIKTYPFMPVEALDTLIVLSALDVIEGAKLTLSKVLGRLPSALKAGFISLVMGLPDKATDLIQNIGGRAAAQIVTSPLSVMACASGIFFELGEEMYKTRASVLKLYHSGVLKWPEKGNPLWPEGVNLEDPKSVEKFIVAQTEAMLNLAPKSSMGRASIPLSVMISWLLVLISGVKSKVAPDALPAVMNLVKIIFFNPIEVWTLNINVFIEHRTINKEFRKERTRIVVQYKNSLPEAKRAEFDRKQNAEWDAKIAAAESPEQRAELVAQREEAQFDEIEISRTETKQISEQEARASMFQMLSAVTMSVTESMMSKNDAETDPQAAEATPPASFTERVNDHAKKLAVSSAEAKSVQQGVKEANIVDNSHSRKLAQAGGYTITTAYDLMSETVGRFIHQAVPTGVNAVFRTNLDTQDRRMKVLMPYGITSEAWRVPVEEKGVDGQVGIPMSDMSSARQPRMAHDLEEVS